MPKDIGSETKRKLLQGTLNPDDKHNIWIRDVYNDSVVFDGDDGKLYEASYTISEDNQVTIGDKKEVRVTYTELGEFNGVEILRAGTFTATCGQVVTFSGEDLDEIVNNAKLLEDVVKPPLVATHDEGSDATIAVFGSVTGGTFHNVRRDGDTVLADVKGVPQQGMDLLDEVKEFRLSPEVYNDFKHEGKSYGQTLRRVSLVDIPAIKTTAGITAANLFRELPDQPTTWVRLNEPVQSKQRKETEDMDNNVRKLQEATEENERIKEENTALKVEKEKATVKILEQEAVDKKRRAEAMVQSLRAAGLVPPIVDRLVQFAEGLDSLTIVKFGEKEQSLFDEFGEILGEMVKRQDNGTFVVQFGEVAPGSDGEHGSEDFKSLVAKFQEEHKCGKGEATKAIVISNPDAHKKYIAQANK